MPGRTPTIAVLVLAGLLALAACADSTSKPSFSAAPVTTTTTAPLPTRESCEAAYEGLIWGEVGVDVSTTAFGAVTHACEPVLPYAVWHPAAGWVCREPFRSDPHAREVFPDLDARCR